MAQKTAITPTRHEDYSEWYLQVVKEGELAENSSVRGCMIIKPWGFALWENMQAHLDKEFKRTGHKNAYFPIFIPLHLMSKEAKHVDGFATECAVVTHHRLEADGKGGLVPAGELEEPLIVRPTSEMIIGESMSKWINSYRDLPMLLNQWGNVVRWEMRTRLFLRTAEFLWHEGHTAHENAEEAQAEVKLILDIFEDFAKEHLAMPVITGRKSPSERFAGADDTLTIEAMMFDRKALQAGTSHFLGQNFAKALDITYQSKEGKEEFVWTTSWAVSTRLIGGLIMTHADDDGLVLPPRIASAHVVLLPMLKKEEDKVLDYCYELKKELEALTYHGRDVVVEIDTNDRGSRKWDWVRKGVPLRIEIGAREVEAGQISVSRRDKAHNERESMTNAELVDGIGNILDDMHKNLYNKALDYRTENTKEIKDKESFKAFFTAKKEGDIHGGFALSHWDGTEETEAEIKNQLGVTIRCIPLDEPESDGNCVWTGKPSKQRVIFAKSY